MSKTKPPEPAGDDHPFIAYSIMTAEGWKPLSVKVKVEKEVMRNPFRHYQMFGHKNFEQWLKTSG